MDSTELEKSQGAELELLLVRNVDLIIKGCCFDSHGLNTKHKEVKSKMARCVLPPQSIAGGDWDRSWNDSVKRCTGCGAVSVTGWCKRHLHWTLSFWTLGKKLACHLICRYGMGHLESAHYNHFMYIYILTYFYTDYVLWLWTASKCFRILQPATKFHGNQFGTFCPILLRHKTDRQSNQIKSNRTIKSHSLPAVNIASYCLRKNVLHILVEILGSIQKYTTGIWYYYF